MSSNVQAKRPIAITIVCILCFVGAIFLIPFVFSRAAGDIGLWYPPYLAFSGMVGAISGMGLWSMRKWAAYLYIGSGVFNQIVMIATGIWSPIALIVPAIVAFFLLRHIRQMSEF